LFQFPSPHDVCVKPKRGRTRNNKKRRERIGVPCHPPDPTKTKKVIVD